MRSIVNFTLHAALAAVLAAFAATGAAAQYLALGDSIPAGAAAGSKQGKEKWIEIQGWDWSDQTAEAGGLAVKQKAEPGPKGGNVEFQWKVEEGESAPPRPTRPSDVTMKRGTSATGDPDRPLVAGRIPSAGVKREMKESGEKGGTEDINIGVGELQEASVSKSSDKATPKLLESAAKGKLFSSPAPAEKRQHGWNTVSKPLERGSVRVKVKFPWVGCTVGARYPVITLGDGTRSYRLQDVTVASCGRSGDADDRPTEEVAFYYNKIVFN